MRVWRTLSYCWASSAAFLFGYLIRSEFWISALKASMLTDCNFRYLIVCGTVRLRLDGICKLATTEKWSEIKSEAETERTLHPKEQIIRSREWPWMWLGKSTYWWRSRDSKIPDSCLALDDEESIQRLKSPIRAIQFTQPSCTILSLRLALKKRFPHTSRINLSIFGSKQDD